jgi:hypothetical protein
MKSKPVKRRRVKKPVVVCEDWGGSLSGREGVVYARLTRPQYLALAWAFDRALGSGKRLELLIRETTE